MLSGAVKEIEGVGSGASEGVLIEHFFCQGADQGLAAEWAAVILFGALDDVVDVQGPFGREEYVIYDNHIRLAFGIGWGALALFGAAQGAEGAELGQSRMFEDLKEVIFIDWVHRARKKLSCGPNIWYE
jgi:hypothetical protein